MFTVSVKTPESPRLSEQCSSDNHEGSVIASVIEPSAVLDMAMALIIDNSGKILLVQSVGQDDGVTRWGIPTSNITATETAAESAVRGLMANAGFTVAPNHLLSLGSITSELENCNTVHLFLHKTSQVRYSPSYASTLTDSRNVRWIHKVRIADSIKTRDITDFGTISLFEKAVLLGII